MTETTTGELIDALVRVMHGDADLRTQQLYRQNLQVLVELAKLEQRQEYDIEFAAAPTHRCIHSVY